MGGNSHIYENFTKLKKKGDMKKRSNLAAMLNYGVKFFPNINLFFLLYYLIILNVQF